MDSKDIARFRSKVEQLGPNECWPWKAGKDAHGYGAIRMGERTMKSHRIAFFLQNGHWPEPSCCHSCDNPPCCNPAHLFAGSQRDNMQDASKKGRVQSGDLHYSRRCPELRPWGDRNGMRKRKLLTAKG